jgi:hypothetical protein
MIRNAVGTITNNTVAISPRIFVSIFFDIKKILFKSYINYDEILKNYL